MKHQRIIASLGFLLLTQGVWSQAADQNPAYEAYLKNGKYPELIQLLSRSKEKLGYLEEYYLGLAYFRIEDDANAQTHLLASISENPSFFRAHDYLAASYFYSGNDAAAETEYKVCLGLDASYARGYYMLGQIQERTARVDQALESYRRAATLDPSDASYAFRAGYLLYAKADFEQAISFLSAGLKLSPDSYAATSLLLESYFRSGKSEQGEPLKAALFKIRKNSPDKRLKDLKSFQFDEFAYKGFRLVFSQIFEPAGDLYYYWTATVYDGAGKVVKTVNLESSAVIREMGTPYIVGVDEYNQGRHKHRTTNLGFKEIPPYEVMKDLVRKEIDDGLGEGASSMLGSSSNGEKP